MVEETLPDAELEVLACLWKHRELTARQVREQMQSYRPMTHSAVSTLLKRLQDKGMVDRKKGPTGKAFLFVPKSRPKPAYRKIVQDLLQCVFGGNALAVVSSLYEGQPPSAQELDELQELVDRLRHNRDAKGKRT